MTTNFKIRTLCLAVFAVIFAACNNPSEPSESNKETTTLLPNRVQVTPEQARAIQLQLGPVELRNLSAVVKANGMLDVPPQNLVTISAPLGGFVKNTELLQGMKVQKGQTVVVLQHPDYVQLQQDYLEVKSQLEFLKTEYQRQEELARENVNATKVLQQAKSNYEVSLAKSAGLKTKLQLLGIQAEQLSERNLQSTVVIPSPINGFVTQVNVNIGMYVNPTDVMFKIVDTEHLHAELIVYERDIPKIEIGQKVRFTLANESKERLAEVYLVGREIGPDRTVRIHCHLDKEDHNLLPGMYLSAYVEAGPRQVPSLPEEAIVNFEGKDYVFVPGSEQGTYQMIPVVKGVNELGYTELSLGKDLKVGSQVVVKGAYDLLSKLKNSDEE